MAVTTHQSALLTHESTQGASYCTLIENMPKQAQQAVRERACEAQQVAVAQAAFSPRTLRWTLLQARGLT